jgi:hypothetical protein
MKIIFETKRELPMIRVRLLKRRRRKVKVDPKLGGQWKVPILVANGWFQAWWPMEGCKLGGQWKVKEKTLFTSSIFPPTTFTHTFNFSL